MKKVFGFLVFLLLMASCRQYKDIVLFQDIKSNQTVNTIQDSLLYQLQPGDVLYINIKGLDMDNSTLFNSNPLAAASLAYQNAMYFMGYDIDNEGYVKIPVIGKVAVAGKTIQQAREAISSEADKYLNGGVVTLKMVNIKVTVMGEVKSPGVYYTNNNRFTVLDALSMAGDITIYGKIRSVLVMRTIGDKTSTFRVNLASKNLFEQEGFHLLPNDIVYVEADKNKVVQNNLPTFSLIFSSVTTILLFLNYFK